LNASIPLPSGIATVFTAAGGAVIERGRRRFAARVHFDSWS
jgi:hypothetical protein